MKTSHLISIVALTASAAGFMLGRSFSDPRETVTLRGVKTTHQLGGNLGKTAERDNGATATGITDPSRSLDGMSSEQIKQVTLQALREPDYVKRWAALGQIAAAMNSQNAQSIIDALASRYKEGGNTFREGELMQFCEGRLLGAASIVLPREPNGRPSFPVQHKMRGWASADPMASRQFIEDLPPGITREMLMGRWQEGLKDATPEVVAAIFDKIDPALQRSMTPKMLEAVFTKDGLDGLSSWYANAVTAGTDPGVVQEAWREIVSRMSQDPGNWNRAMDFVRDQAGTQDVASADFSMITRRIALGAPGKLIDMFSSMSETNPDMEERLPQLIRETIDTSTAQSLNLVGEWLQANREHKSYDRVAYEFALRSIKDDPEAANEWASTIKEEGLRTEWLSRMQQNQAQ